MTTSITRLAVLILAATLAACASGGARGTGAASASVTAPDIIGREFPDLSGTPPDRRPMQVDLRVMVNPDGTPDMSTVKVTGASSAATRDAFVTWIARSRFTPGSQGGIPVRAEYRMKMKTRIVRRIA